MTSMEHLLDTTKVKPMRDGQYMIRLFEHLIYLASLHPGITHVDHTTGYEIVHIQKELPVFLTYLFQV